MGCPHYRKKYAKVTWSRLEVARISTMAAATASRGEQPKFQKSAYAAIPPKELKKHDSGRADGSIPFKGVDAGAKSVGVEPRSDDGEGLYRQIAAFDSDGDRICALLPAFVG